MYVTYKIFENIYELKGDTIMINPVYAREEILDEIRNKKEKISEEDYSSLEKKLIDDKI